MGVRVGVGVGVAFCLLWATPTPSFFEPERWGAVAVTIYGDAPESSENVVVVNHGSNAATARPSAPQMVVWYGSVQPQNATGIDIVIRTDEAV